MGTIHTDKTWRFYGRKAPYYGVIGLDMYHNANLTEQIITDFFTSGKAYVEELFVTIHRKIDPDFKAERILDFGCGPGRLIIPFSKYANEVVGIDISQEMIAEAKKNCLKYDVNNASFFLSDDNLNCIKDKEFDLVNSFIVLQHINIKRGEKLFNMLLKSIKVNGIGVLHLTYYDNFCNRRVVNFLRFRIPFLSNILRILRGNKFISFPHMQMNNYNVNKILSFLQKANIKDFYSTFTNHHNYYGIILYFKKN